MILLYVNLKLKIAKFIIDRPQNIKTKKLNIKLCSNSNHSRQMLKA